MTDSEDNDVELSSETESSTDSGAEHLSPEESSRRAEAVALPYFSAVLPGIGGRLKTTPEDFFVEELPLYPAAGEGEFAWLLIEKRNLSTPELVAHIARSAQIPLGEIGTAGRKDKAAVTRQYVSLPARSLTSPSVLESEQVKVLSADRHRNKLRTGHLSGNHFRIVLRDVADGALTVAREIEALITRLGFPNYYGEQRFGFTDDTDSPGFRLLRNERTRRFSKSELRFTLSAAQSRLFNDWATRRVIDGLSHRVLPGDVMQVTASGGCFTAEDVEAEQARFDAHETVLTGPIFGPKMRLPAAEAAAREDQILEDWHLPREAFEHFKKLTSGTRRPLIVWPKNFSVQPGEDRTSLIFEFTLPSGAYATCLLREFQKLGDF